MAKDRDECILCRQDENDARDLGGFDGVCGEAIQPGGGTNGQGREFDGGGRCNIYRLWTIFSHDLGPSSTLVSGTWD
jgi:hypothetical protein